MPNQITNDQEILESDLDSTTCNMLESDDTTQIIHDDQEIPESDLDSTATQLPKPLQKLFALNGATEALPALALMAMVNDRIQIPVTFLPAYYAVAFLPYSLKPIYAVAARVSKLRHNILLVALLVSSSIALQITAFLGNDQIVACFLIAFIRGVCISSAEFMVGLTLISTASNSVQTSNSDAHANITKQKNHEVLLSCFQSQAATSRNIGSLMAHIFSFGVLSIRNYIAREEDDDQATEMSNELVTSFLLTTSIFPLIAAFVACKSQIGRDVTGSHGRVHGSRGTRTNIGNQQRSFFKNLKYDIIAVLLLQVLLIMFGLQRLIIVGTSKVFFGSAFASVCILLTVAILYSRRSQRQLRYSALNEPNDEVGEDETGPLMRHLMFVKRVAVYLILRHATPDSGVMMSSYIYDVFRTRPVLLQSLSMAGSVTAVCSTWTYGKTLARNFASLDGIKSVIIITTVASSIWSLLSIPFVRAFRIEDEDSMIVGGAALICLYITFQLVGSFISELSFMPSVVLATTSTMQKEEVAEDPNYEEDNEIESCQDESTRNGESNQRINHDGFGLDNGIQYGILVACIDFGDQLSDFVAMPIIEAFGIRRDNDWQNLEWFVLTCSGLGIVSLVFVKMLSIKST